MPITINAGRICGKTQGFLGFLFVTVIISNVFTKALIMFVLFYFFLTSNPIKTLRNLRNYIKRAISELNKQINPRNIMLWPCANFSSLCKTPDRVFHMKPLLVQQQDTSTWH